MDSRRKFNISSPGDYIENFVGTSPMVARLQLVDCHSQLVTWSDMDTRWSIGWIPKDCAYQRYALCSVGSEVLRHIISIYTAVVCAILHCQYSGMNAVRVQLPRRWEVWRERVGWQGHGSEARIVSEGRGCPGGFSLCQLPHTCACTCPSVWNGDLGQKWYSYWIMALYVWLTWLVFEHSIVMLQWMGIQ